MSRGWQPLVEFDFDRRLMDTPGVALVLFGQPGCGGCRAWHRLLPGWLPGDVSLYYADVAQATALARRFDLFHLPALALYRDGHFHAMLQAPLERGALLDAFYTALSAAAEDEP